MQLHAIRRAIGTAVLAVALAGCGRTADSPSTAASTAQAGSVLALVAASTKDAVQAIAADFTRETGVEVKINADDSSKLATQIVNAAPADVFLSANQKWADHVKDQGFGQEAVALLGNTLVIVVPQGNPAKVAKPDDLTAPAVKKVAVAGPTVPAGIYARQALAKLNLWDELEKAKKIVPGENVRVTLTYVELAEVEAGIVYGTDALISKKIEAAYTFEPTTHDKIVYPLALLKAGEKNEAARKFYQYLQSPAAAEAFKKHCFTWLGK